VIPRFAEAIKIPVLSGLPVGHDPKRQMTLPLGTAAVLHTGRAPWLEVSSGIAAP
jgi:muramoyltetrapeptide carboxypeptidase LdcA involved in peptidoglycan recycling